MKTRLIPLSIAVAAALMTSSSALEAASLGPLRSVSALGASFRAEIALVGGGADAACFRVVAPLDGGDIPALADGRISVVGSGRNARLVVLNARRINDPIIRLVVENQCESRLQREYTLLMPFAGAPAADATPARAQAPRPAPSARPARTEARPAPPHARNRAQRARGAPGTPPPASRSHRSRSPSTRTTRPHGNALSTPPLQPTRRSSPTRLHTAGCCRQAPH